MSAGNPVFLSRSAQRESKWCLGALYWGQSLVPWTPKTPFPWRRGLWLGMNHTSGHCKLQVLKAEVREQRCTPRIEVFIMISQLRWNHLWSGSGSSLRAEDTSWAVRSNTLELYGLPFSLLCFVFFEWVNFWDNTAGRSLLRGWTWHRQETFPIVGDWTQPWWHCCGEPVLSPNSLTLALQLGSCESF